MTHHRGLTADDSVATAAAVAETLFADAAERDVAAAFPAAALRLLHESELMMAPFPVRLGGTGLVEPAAVDALVSVLRLVGGGDLSVGRLYEGHVNAVALVGRYGSAAQLERLAEDVRAGGMSGVWNAEGAEPAGLVPEDEGWRLAGRKILASGVGSVSRPLVPVARDGVTLMTLPRLAPGERADLSRWTAQGMRSTATGTVDLAGLPIGPDDIVGRDDDYRRQPTFFGGAWRFCAVQLGAIDRLLDLYRADLVRLGRGADPYQRQRVAACATAAETAALWVGQAACMVAAEARPVAEILAYVGLTRGVVERAGLDTMEAVHRGLGLGAHLRPHPVERVCRDLATYLRQPAPDGAMADAAATVLASPEPARTLWRPA